MPPEKRDNSHYTEEEMNRRIAEYRKINAGDQASQTIIGYFKERNIDHQIISCEDAEKYNLAYFEKFIQRKEKCTNNFVTQDAEGGMLGSGTPRAQLKNDDIEAG